MGAPRDARRTQRDHRARAGAPALALIFLAAPAWSQGALGRLPALWAHTRDGFVDDLRSGALTREDLGRLIMEFEPQMNEHLFAARIVYEAAHGVGDEELLLRSHSALFRSFGALTGRAASFRREGRRRRSRALFADARVLLPDDSPYVPFALQGAAIDAEYFQDWEVALALVAEALSRVPSERRYGLPLRVDLLVLRAGIYLGMGLPDLAAEPVRAAFEGLDQMRSAGFAARSQWLAAEQVRAQLRDHTFQFELLIREVELALDSLGEPDDLLESELRDRARLLIRLGLGRMELGAVRPEFLKSAESALHEARKLEHAGSLGRFTCEIHLAWIALLEERHADAADWLERARARAESSDLNSYLLGFLAALEARLDLDRGADREALQLRRHGLERALARMMDTWTADAPRPGGLAFLRYPERRFAVATLMELALALEAEGGELEALRVLYDVGRAGTLARRLGGTEASLEQARAALIPSGGGLLVYLVGRDRSHVFALEREEVVHAELAGEWTLRASVRAVDELLLRNPHAMEERERSIRRRLLEERAAQLARELLPPAVLERVGQWDTVTVVGADLLGQPDFECLPFDGATLGVAVPLGYLASLRQGMALLERAVGARERGSYDVRLVAAVPVGARELPELALSRAEAERLVRPFGERAELLLGNDATHARIAAGAPGPGLLCFLSHGLPDRTAERPGRILVKLADGDDALSPDEVEQLAVPSSVYLGVCGSARAPSREGAGPVAHLGGAFLLAGADAVVLSDSELLFEPTLGLTEAYLAGLAAGASPAEALRRARVALVAAGWDDPHDHAQMRVIGLAHAPVFARAPEAR